MLLEIENASVEDLSRLLLKEVEAKIKREHEIVQFINILIYIQLYHLILIVVFDRNH